MSPRVSILRKENSSRLLAECTVGNMNRCRSLRWGLLLLFVAAAPLGGQTQRLSDGQTNPLPRTTGAPLTIVPIDRQDIDCSIQEWNSGLPQPFLKLICPPRAEFAPLRVYLKLSWMTPDDPPDDLGRIISPPNGLTKIRTNRTAVMVRLEVAGEPGHAPREKWVGFNGVVDFALIKERR